MGSKFCMNASCTTTSTVEWKKGWPLRSGLLADLCHPCGSAYESSLFCDQFHKDQSGWRECYLCKRRLHCGCIASKVMTELMDYGGVGCRTCVTSHQLNLIRENPNVNPNVLSRLPMKMLPDSQLVNGESGMSIDGGRNGADLISQSQRCESQPLVIKGDKREELRPYYGVDTLMKSEVTTTGYRLGVGEMHESSPSQPSLNMSLAVNQFSPSFSTECVEGKKQIGAPQSNVVHGSASNILQKPSKRAVSTPLETSKSAQVRRGRPPVEGRGRGHLLPRYWPKYTDKEVQQISGNLNVNVVPLFEKILSASDAGRIGRLVLPKACAEAYFPPIPAPNGIPLNIQDVKGQEWIFQYRYWPNNNSRMYVLEGVTPCIQSLDLVAGDIVTFSRDPNGKLIMGYRKVANAGGIQVYGLTNGTSTEETSSRGVTETPSFINGSSCPSLIPKELNGMPEDLSSPYGGSSSKKSENNGVKIGDDPRQVKEKKRTRTTGTRNKRLLLHSEESMVTWEEAQDMLRPSPSATRSIVDIEEHEFEAYDEPPVFGKRTIITSRPSGEQERWASCDDCFKWRRLPADALLSLKWTCIDNVWDVARCSCSAPEENLKELENVLKVGREYKKKRTGEIQGAETEQESSGLYALASVAVLGDTVGKPEVATTTKHPRHRAGCSCIVCIQPPSGKGRHKSSCDCNVCSTVQRRFKTLQMRRNKKKQIKLDGSAAEDKEKTETEAAESSKDKAEEVINTGRIDLNSDPYSREDTEAAIEEKEEGKKTEIGECSGVAQGGDALGDEAENIHGEP